MWEESMRFGLCALALAAVVAASPVQATVQGVAQVCAGGRICAWFKPVLTSPPGWTEDKRAGDENQLAVLVPRGQSFASAKARIYGRAFLNDEGLSVEDRVRVSNERWVQASPGATYERVDDVHRSDGRGAFQVFRYRNPARRQQPLEYTAFGEDKDEAGRRFGILIVLTATSEKSLTANEAAFQALLRQF
jgi:hypothetical protein